MISIIFVISVIASFGTLFGAPIYIVMRYKRNKTRGTKE